ncbi:MAG: hypothetical protein ACI8XB_001877 [Patiriisocius sp.]|jgi:hypothetical protein
MRKISLIILTSMLMLNFCYSQDIITKSSGEEIEVRILEITTSLVRFKMIKRPNGRIYRLPKHEILVIRYQNGTHEVFNDTKADKIETDPIEITASYVNPYFNGEKAAIKHYDGYKEAATGTLVVSLLSPLVGLLPAITTSATHPKDSYLHYPKSELMDNREYYRGYTYKAKKIKRDKVWTNWGIAFGINVLAAMVIVSR